MKPRADAPSRAARHGRGGAVKLRTRPAGPAGAVAACAAALAAALGGAGDARAYHVLHVTDTFLVRAWPARRLPVPFRMDRGIVENEPDLLALVRDGAGAWNGLPDSYAGTLEYGWTPVPTTLANVQAGLSLNVGDGIPEIAVDFDGDVYAFLGIDSSMVTGVGVTELANDGVIVDGFVLLNGTVPLWDGGDATREIVAHETGHLFGFGHSGVTDRFVDRDGAAFPTMSGSTRPPLLAADDVAVASALYPDCDFEARYGAITGAVRRGDGSGSRGVSVTAVALDGGAAVGHLTGTFDDAGSYHIAGVPPGDYFVYVEPLDGSQDGAGRSPELVDFFFIDRTDLGFEVEAFADVAPGSGAETVVTVEAGRTTGGVDFVLGLGSGEPAPVVTVTDGAAPAFPLGAQSNGLPLGGAPLAAIDTAATTVLAGTPVAFDGTASRSCAGPVVSWSWDFDDAGATATDAAPEHTFAAVGTYDVTLVVTDDTGAAGNHFVRMAVVNELPPEPEPPGCGCRIGGDRTASGATGGAAGALAGLAWLLVIARRARHAGRRPEGGVIPSRCGSRRRAPA